MIPTDFLIFCLRIRIFIFWNIKVSIQIRLYRFIQLRTSLILLTLDEILFLIDTYFICDCINTTRGYVKILIEFHMLILFFYSLIPYNHICNRVFFFLGKCFFLRLIFHLFEFKNSL